MATGLPGKIISVIQKDVQRDMKKGKKAPWQGFGPIAEASLTKSGNGAIIAWRQGTTIEGTKYNYMIGGYIKTEDGWKLVGDVKHAANYDAGANDGVAAVIKQVQATVADAEKVAA
jgi:hypothetical protein